MHALRNLPSFSTGFPSRRIGSQSRISSFSSASASASASSSRPLRSSSEPIRVADPRRGMATKAFLMLDCSSDKGTYGNGVKRAARAVQGQAMEAEGGGRDPRLAKISSSIRVIPDFPKPGILFQDITTLLLDPVAFRDTIDIFVERYRGRDISVVAGIEARGFIFGPPIALAIGAKFVPMRKPNKLPGEVISEEYSLEYGTDKIEMHVGAVQAGERALVVDDLIATGGTLSAAIRLLERVGVDVVECACIIELPELKGRERLGDKPLFVLVSS